MPSEETTNRALAAAKTSMYERVLIQHVREQGAPCRVNVTHLGAVTGIDRANLSHARTDLVRDGVLLRTDDGMVFNPDATQWANGRITRKGLAHALADVEPPHIGGNGVVETVGVPFVVAPVVNGTRRRPSVQERNHEHYVKQAKGIDRIFGKEETS